MKRQGEVPFQKKMNIKIDFSSSLTLSYGLSFGLNVFIALYDKCYFTQEHQPCLFNLLTKFSDLPVPCRLTNFLFEDLPGNCIDLHYVHNTENRWICAICTFLFSTSLFTFEEVKARPVPHTGRRTILSVPHIQGRVQMFGVFPKFVYSVLLYACNKYYKCLFLSKPFIVNGNVVGIEFSCHSCTYHILVSPFAS